MALALVLTTVAAPAAGQTPAASPEAASPLARAVAYLLSQQGTDGSFPGYSGQPDPGSTADAVVALGAARQAGIDVAAPLTAALGYLRGEAAGYAAKGEGQAAKLALAALAAGDDPQGFAGLDLLDLAAGRVAAGPTPAAGIPGVYGDDLYDHALVLLALAASGRQIPPAALDALRTTQQADGAWAADGSAEAGSGDSNTTALAVQAFVAAGLAADPAVARAMAYLRTLQTANGQFAFQTADPLAGDANSSALAVQAIVATGGDPAAPEWRDAAAGLAAFQNAGGAFRYTDAEPGDNLYATLQAIPALAGQALPVGSRCPAAAGATPLAATPTTAPDGATCLPLPRTA